MRQSTIDTIQQFINPETLTPECSEAIERLEKFCARMSNPEVPWHALASVVAFYVDADGAPVVHSTPVDNKKPFVRPKAFYGAPQEEAVPIYEDGSNGTPKTEDAGEMSEPEQTPQQQRAARARAALAAKREAAVV